MKKTIWDVAPSSLVETYRRFGGFSKQSFAPRQDITRQFRCAHVFWASSFKINFRIRMQWIQRSVETTCYTVRDHYNCRPANIRVFCPGVFN